MFDIIIVAVQARVSKSLPAMLDGIASKLKKSSTNPLAENSVKSKDMIKVQPISKMVAAYSTTLKNPMSDTSVQAVLQKGADRRQTICTSNLARRNRRKRSKLVILLG